MALRIWIYNFKILKYMNKKFGLISILVLGLLLIVAILYYVFSFSTDDPAPKIGDTDSASKVKDAIKVIENQDSEIVKVKKPVTTVRRDIPLGQASLERMARSFAERFGSFSNQSNFSNISDLKMVMSNNMQSWADAYIEKNKKPNVANDVYYGLTTKALSTQVNNFDDTNGEAKITVETRRREAMGTTNNASKLYNQKIVITFVKEKGAWRVDSAYWEE